MTSNDLLHRRLTATFGAVTGIALSGTLLAVSGEALPFPSHLTPDALARWVGEAGAVTATFTALRALAVLLLGWLVVTGALAIAARLVRRPDAVRLVDRWTLPFVRRLADLAVGISVVVAGLAPATVAGAATASTTMTTTTTAVAVAAPVTMRDLGPVAPAAAVTPLVQPTPSVPARSSGTSTWVIGPGDTLWHVADVSLTDELGRPPSTTEVAGRLERIVHLNRDRLAVPGDADLVFPGQEFVLP